MTLVSSYFMCFAWVYLGAYLGNEILKGITRITQNRPKRLVGFLRLGDRGYFENDLKLIQNTKQCIRGCLGII